MKMHELIRHGVPSEMIELWCRNESDILLPLQEMAVKRHDLLSAQRNLLIQAPTSSGKTFIGEMAAIHTAMQRKKVVYLVPLKALAEEKYHDFKEKYSPYGLRVIISTRDHREFDRQLENGNFSIAVVVYEKLSQLLVRRPERMEEVALVLADELEILSDPDRGAMVEVLLTRILQTDTRLIGLSAVIGGADKLAQWMDATLVSYERRPVELRYGVLFDGVFRYHTFNESGEGEERLADVHAESPWEIVMENARTFSENGESCLIFVKDKNESRRGAERIAEHMALPAAAKAIKDLREIEPTRSRDCLMNTLNTGVAFHNADLSPEERRVVEAGFRAGEIKTVVSTSTLAAGMNLPAQNVFIAADKWRYDKRFGLPWRTPILHTEYVNMSGRAGRYGIAAPGAPQQPFGRSIMVAVTPFDVETFWRRYVEGECEHVEPRLVHDPLEDHVLRLVASRFCHCEDELHRFLENTLTGKWVWLESLTREEVAFRVAAAANRAIDAGMLTKDPRGRLDATPLGLAVAAKGISIATAQELEHWIAQSETRGWNDVDLLLAAAMTPDGRMVQVSLTSREYEHADYPGKLKKLAEDCDISADVPLNRIRNCNLMPFYEEVRAIKAALFLSGWLEHEPLGDLEEAYRTTAGQILTAANQISWLVDAAGAIATALGAKPAFIEETLTLAERVQHGLRAEALPLARVTGAKLRRNDVATLLAHGLHTPQALEQATLETLTSWIAPAQARRLKDWASRHLDGTPSPEPEQSKQQSSVPVLIVDDKHPSEIHLDGKRIRLQDKQYRLICALAASAGECVPYDTIYEAVWGEAIVESNQMHFQKRKLLDCIKAQLPGRANLITTVAKRGFVLGLTPEQVALRQLDSANAA